MIAAGGLLKNKFLMQMCSDVTRVSVADTGYASSLGSAIHGAVAAGAYPDVHTAAEAMARDPQRLHAERGRPPSTTSCTPSTSSCTGFFGRGGNKVMYRLKDLKREAMARKHG
ncbi:MAG: hypothetical protein R2719_00175 [Micropruina sp.]